MRIGWLGVICAFAIGLASQANASIVYQSVADLTRLPATDLCSPCSFAPTSSIGQAFSFANSAAVTDAKFAIQGDYNWPSPVTLSIFFDSDGTIGDQIFSQRFTSYDSDIPHTNYNPYSNLIQTTDVVSVHFSPILLNAGNYLLFITGDTDLGVPMYEVEWGTGGMVSMNNDLPATGVNYIKTDFLSAGVILASAPIPEPKTWSMLLVGFFGAGSMLRGRSWRLFA